MEKLVFFTQAEIIYFKQPFPLDIVEPEKKKKKSHPYYHPSSCIARVLLLILTVNSAK
jgi:hypothetical protein